MLFRQYCVKKAYFFVKGQMQSFSTRLLCFIISCCKVYNDFDKKLAYILNADFYRSNY